MSYMRGSIYCWTDSDERLHVWVAGEPDGYEESAWGEGWRERGVAVNGVALPGEALDELVMMRLAQMTPDEREAASRRAIEKWHGNGGCIALAESRGLPPLRGVPGGSQPG